MAFLRQRQQELDPRPGSKPRLTNMVMVTAASSYCVHVPLCASLYHMNPSAVLFGYRHLALVASLRDIQHRLGLIIPGLHARSIPKF